MDKFIDFEEQITTLENSVNVEVKKLIGSMLSGDQKVLTLRIEYDKGDLKIVNGRVLSIECIQYDVDNNNISLKPFHTDNKINLSDLYVYDMIAVYNYIHHILTSI